MIKNRWIEAGLMMIIIAGFGIVAIASEVSVHRNIIAKIVSAPV